MANVRAERLLKIPAEPSPELRDRRVEPLGQLAQPRVAGIARHRGRGDRELRELAVGESEHVC